MGTLLDPADIAHLSVDGIRTRYLDRGTGSPVVLVHGGHFGIFVPMGLEVWSENIGPLSAHARVIAFDKLGQGWTDLPERDEDWTFERVLAHAQGFLDALDLDDVTLVGHSRGGLLAARLAIALPDRVRRLVVVSSASTAPAQPGVSDMGFYDEVERTVPAGTGSRGMIEHYHAAQEVSEGPLAPAAVDLAVEMAESGKHKESVDTYRRAGATTWVPSLERAKRVLLDHLEGPGLAVPTLVVWGKDDRSAPLALGHQFFTALTRHTERCAMLIVNRAGHQVFRDQPRLFNDALLTFLAG